MSNWLRLYGEPRSKINEGFFLDDKNIVIVSVTILGLAILYSGAMDLDRTNLLTGIFSGLFGIAVGKASK